MIKYNVSLTQTLRVVRYLASLFSVHLLSAESYGDQVYLRSNIFLRPSIYWYDASNGDQHREPKIDKQIIKMIKCTLGPTTFNLNPPAPTAWWSKGKIMIQIFLFCKLIVQMFRPRRKPLPSAHLHWFLDHVFYISSVQKSCFSILIWETIG